MIRACVVGGYVCVGVWVDVHVCVGRCVRGGVGSV